MREHSRLICVSEHPVVARDREAQARADPRERHALVQSERQAQRVRLDAARGDHPPVELDGRQDAGHVHGLDPGLPQQAVRRRARACEDVRAEVQPVLVAPLRADPTAHAVAGLEDEHVEVAQPPGRCEACNTPADDDDVPHEPSLDGGEPQDRVGVSGKIERNRNSSRGLSVR